VARQLSMQRALGCVQELVSARECVALEPALEAALLHELAFGVWTPGEQVIDGARLAQGLARASGATLLLGTRALSFEAGRGAVQALHTDQGRIEADAFVVAAGHESAPLLEALGLRLPIEPIKGYSVTLPVVDAAAAPRASITDHARKMVFARLGGTLRVAGFAELVGADTRLDDARVGALCRAAEACFPGACRVDDPQGWAGLRPATPGSRPLIGPTPWAHLWLNTGHGGLGLTLAAGSAALLGELMSGGPASIDPTPYRFNPPRP
jgi:D-amino-acid dehydrogenase